jgi:hypothetical protein
MLTDHLNWQQVAAATLRKILSSQKAASKKTRALMSRLLWG